MGRAGTASWALAAGLLVVCACGGNDSGDTSADQSDASNVPGAVDAPDASNASGGTPTEGTSAGTPTPGGELTAITSSNPSSLDPITGGSGGDHPSLYPFYDRLINFDPETLTPTPGLASEWEFVDPTTLMLTLRQGVVFHDGTPFDAAAVKFNLERAMTFDGSTVTADLSMIERVAVDDPTHVRITLAHPDSSLVLILADRPGMMVSPTAAKDDPDGLRRHPVGTGPYRFVEWLPNDRLVAEKNADYWQQGKPYLDRITLRYIVDQQTAINALLAGEADMYLRVRPDDVATLEQRPELTISSSQSLWMDACYFNLSQPPFDSAEVREAVNLAIDRQAFTDAFSFGYGAPAQQLFPEGYWAYDDELAETYGHDTDRAKQLLDDAGYGDGLQIEAVAANASAEVRKSEIVQAQLADVGIDMEFEAMEVGAATSKFFEDLDYDLYCAGWSGRPDPSQTALAIFGRGAFFNAGDYVPPGMADALDAAGASDDLDKRAAAFSDVTRIAQDESLFVPLVHVPDINAFTQQVQGFTPSLYGKPDLSFLWVTP